VGTFGGLNLLSPDRTHFTRYQNIEGDSSSVSNNKILTIAQADEDNLWVGTLGGGLNYFNFNTGLSLPIPKTRACQAM
jgi:ligand-binding sensor domain-containing protein